MNDIIEVIGKSLVQHGKNSDRVYLMKLCSEDYPCIINDIYNLAHEKSYSKIFIKVPKWAQEGFESAGYTVEACIPHFYNGKQDGLFMALYLDPKRKEKSNAALIDEIISLAKNAAPYQAAPKRNQDYQLANLGIEDAEDISQIYKRVFETYPFPIHNPAYIKDTMNDNVVYFGIRDKGQLIAVSSSEMDIKSQNVEMTDFATLPEYRSQGLASSLLYEMENAMRQRGIMTAYTIARAVSHGMNITFAKHNYIYSGTLINNTDISGEIESMNVWYKAL